MIKKNFSKTVLVTALGLGGTYSFSTSAAEVGNLINSDSGRFKISINAETSKRDIKQTGDWDFFKITDRTDVSPTEYFSEKFTESFSDMEGEEEQDHLYLKLSFAVTPKIEVYGKLGTARSKIKMKDTATYTERYTETFTENGRQVFSESEVLNSATEYGVSSTDRNKSSGLFAGIGIKAVLHEWSSSGWKFVLDAQYQYKKMGDSPFAMSETSDDIVSKETQASLMFAKNTGAFQPYIGVSYTDLKMKYDTWQFYDNNYTSTSGLRTDTIEFENKNNVGLFAGFEYSVGKNMGIGGEVRAGAEEALNLNLNYSF